MANECPISPASTSPTWAASFSRSSTAAVQNWDPISPPFQKCNQLCKDLDYVHEPEKPACLQSHGSLQSLPDAPRVRLDCPSQVLSYCLQDLETPGMDKLGEKLWWAGPTPDIVTLSQQAVLDRRIQLTEDPSVHLLWTEGIIFVKPIPAYLTSYAFWEYLLAPSTSEINSEERERLKSTSLGFLGTYSSLIQRRSDFNMARRHDLLAAFGGISFEMFISFISAFDSIPTHAISSRWRYGLLELDALNFHSAIHLRRWHLNRFESRYSTYFTRFFPVVLFIFALFSVMLSAMQVILAAKQMRKTEDRGLKRILDLFVWAGTETIGWSLAFGLVFIIWFIIISTVEACKRRKMQQVVRKRLKAECTGSRP